MTPEQILAEARQLPTEQMNELVDQLLAECFARPDPEIDETWRAETRRRVGEIQSGKVTGLPGEEVMSEVRKIIGL
ncbi:MAG TPA: addiction module protein [Opitutaceae bacterium]|nr:addiction module protein [Opitutaceae bacterium]